MRTRRSLPKLGALQAFESVARLGTVSRAAEELSLTQSAVTRQIQALESRLGIVLFTRVNMRLVLTDAGAGYLHDVRGGLCSLEDATEALLSRQGRGGTLRIATLPTFGAKWLMPRLVRFCANRPHIKLELITRLAPFDFEIEQLDGAIHFGGPDWPGAEVDFLVREQMMVVAAPALAVRCATPADVLGLPLLQITSRAFAWQDWLASVELSGSAIDPILQVETFAMGIEAVLNGVCAGILPGFFVAAEIAAGKLKSIGPSISGDAAYYFAFPRRRRDYYPLREFAAWLRVESAESLLKV